MQQNNDLSETILKRLPFFIRSVLNPHWHTSVWQSRVAQTDRLATRKKIYAICVRHQRKIVCWIYRRHWARGRERQKKMYMGLRRHLYWFLSLSFFSISLFVSVCASPFDGCVFPVQVVFRFSPKWGRWLWQLSLSSITANTSNIFY